MSVEAKIRSLQRFIRMNPALADVPFATIAGRPITPRMALTMLRRRENISEVMSALASAGLDPNMADWELAQAYYENLLRKPEPKPKVYVIPQGEVVGVELSLEEALEHLKRRDRIGASLLESYLALKREMARRMR